MEYDELVKITAQHQRLANLGTTVYARTVEIEEPTAGVKIGRAKLTRLGKMSEVAPLISSAMWLIAAHHVELAPTAFYKCTPAQQPDLISRWCGFATVRPTLDGTRSIFEAAKEAIYDALLNTKPKSGGAIWDLCCLVEYSTSRVENNGSQFNSVSLEFPRALEHFAAKGVNLPNADRINEFFAGMRYAKDVLKLSEIL